MLCALGCALVLRLSYGAGTSSDPGRFGYYAVTCSVLACFALPGWIFRLRNSRLAEILTSGLIAMAVSFLFILWSSAFGPVDNMPWQFFYKDDYVVVFLMLAPVTLSALTAILSLIPEPAR
jgi:hypothetical protein